MAHMDIHYGFSVNGVAALHTGHSENTELKDFYKIYPENSIIKQTDNLSAVVNTVQSKARAGFI